MKYFIIAVVAFIMVGCSEEYRQADNIILCDPNTGEAYYVEHHIGDTSMIRPINMNNEFCGRYIE